MLDYCIDVIGFMTSLLLLPNRWMIFCERVNTVSTFQRSGNGAFDTYNTKVSWPRNLSEIANLSRRCWRRDANEQFRVKFTKVLFGQQRVNLLWTPFKSLWTPFSSLWTPFNSLWTLFNSPPLAKKKGVLRKTWLAPAYGSWQWLKRLSNKYSTFQFKLLGPLISFFQ